MPTSFHTTPMDFTWEKGPALDPTSPFAKLGKMNANDGFGGKKRNHDLFNSPTKPEAPSLRDPNSQKFFFDQPKVTSGDVAPPYRTPSFNTPQKQKWDIDFSSGAENLSSPEQADNEETPEPKSSVLFKGTPLDDKSRHHAMYGRFGASPGRGEIPRGKYSNALVNRIQKRRKRNNSNGRQIAHRPSVNEDDRPSSSESNPYSTNRSGSNEQQSFWHRLFSLIESHPNVPNILSWYAQLALNLFFVLVTMRIFWNVWSTLIADVDRASEEVAADALAEINLCARDYVENKCGGAGRVPAMETICENWSRCMNRDPQAVKRSKISVAMFAQILNGFVEPISWKTFMFSMLTMATLFLVSNWTFNSFRAKSPHLQHYYPPSQPHQQYIQMQDHNNQGHDRFTRWQQPGYAGWEQPPQRIEFGRPPSPSKKEYGRTPSPTKRGFQ